MDAMPLLLTDRPWSEMEAEGIASASLYKYFANIRPDDEIKGLGGLGIANENLKNIPHGDFNYVVLKGDVVVLCRRNKDQFIPVGGHIDLALKEVILAGGQLKVYKGEIKEIDNASGHYLPQGLAAKMSAIRAFNKIGFNIAERYVEKFWNGKAWQKKN